MWYFSQLFSGNSGNSSRALIWPTFPNAENNTYHYLIFERNSPRSPEVPTFDHRFPRVICSVSSLPSEEFTWWLSGDKHGHEHQPLLLEGDERFRVSLHCDAVQRVNFSPPGRRIVIYSRWLRRWKITSEPGLPKLGARVAPCVRTSRWHRWAMMMVVWWQGQWQSLFWTVNFV